MPEWTSPGGERFWRWSEVAPWLRHALGFDVEVPPHELTTADRVLAALQALRDEPDETTRRELEGLLRAS